MNIVILQLAFFIKKQMEVSGVKFLIELFSLIIMESFCRYMHVVNFC